MDLSVFYAFSYGIYVVSSRKGDRLNGQIANTAFQVTSDPPRIAISINKQNLTHEYIKDSGIFGVSVLERDVPLKVIGLFGFKSGRDVQKFSEVEYKQCGLGSPVLLEYSLGYIEAKVVDELDVGTHTIFVGEVVEAERLKVGEPMAYAYYHEVKRGKSPKTAPTYVEEEKQKEVKKVMKKYRCEICGYVYDPGVGDPDGGIKPGTPFEDILDDWVCPVCGAGKDQFVLEE